MDPVHHAAEDERNAESEYPTLSKPGYGLPAWVLWRGFELRSFDFFDRNPALDLPR